MSARQFRQGWRKVPLVHRLAVWCLIPVFAIAFSIFGTRRVISRYLNQTDMPSHEMGQLRDTAQELTELLLDHRDALAVEALATIHETRHTEPIDVAVVYGAGHMPGITRELLRRYGYRPRRAEWLTVFDF
jgi:pheromone shutdown protein TraB